MSGQHIVSALVGNCDCGSKVQLWITELRFMDPVIPLGGSYLFTLSMKGVSLL